MTIDYGELLEYLAGAFGIYAFRAKTMIPLRVAATAACACGLAGGIAHVAGPTILVNAVMLPLNLWLLIEMRHLIRDSAAAAESASRPSGYDWLKPFMQRVEFPAGHVLFRKGDVGAEAFLVGSGEVHIPEHDAVVRSGDLLGEIGLLTTGNRRTATAVCRTSVRAWRISYDDMKQLCMQNPEFSLHLAEVIVRRYEANLRRAHPEPREAPAA